MSEEHDVYKDYEETIKECTKETFSYFYPKFSRNSAMYTFSTENISSYLKKFFLKGKTVLAVTSSGDHLINLIFNGVTKIDLFDLNKNAYYFTELKIAALKTLSYNEFLSFFTSCKDVSTKTSIFSIQQRINDNPYIFDYRIYEKLKVNLPKDCSMYWDLLYKRFNNDGKKMSEVVCKNSDRKRATLNNDYLKNELNYNKTKKLVENIEVNYYCMNALELYKLNKKYDIVFLSNIYDYLVGENYNVISEEEFSNYIKNDLSNILNDDGIIALHYQYHYKTRNDFYKGSLKDLFKDKYTIEKKPILDSLSSKKILVPSIIKEYRKMNEKGCLYLYGKTK